MFSTHVTSVCLVRNESDALEHAAVILTPFPRVNQAFKCGFSPFPLSLFAHHTVFINPSGTNAL